jgi:hypothetical protein
MDAVSFTTETIILVLRFAVLIALYLYLWQVVVVVWRDLRRPAVGEGEAFGSAGRLIVIDGGPTSYQPGHAFPVYGSASIGRGADNTIVLSDSFVSTSHAILTYRDGAWYLADLDARNGTWVNSERVKGEVRVRPGDVLAIGQVKLKLAR